MTVGEDALGIVALFVLEAVIAALALGVGIAKPKMRRLVGSRFGLVVVVVVVVVIALVLGASGSIILAITIVAIIIAAALVPALQLALILFHPLFHLGAVRLILAGVIAMLHLGGGAVVAAIAIISGRGGGVIDANLRLVLGPARLVIVVAVGGGGAGRRIRRPQVVPVVGIARVVLILIILVAALVLGSTGRIGVRGGH
mmetsp:Transcript_11566/g.32818  ORF Transcript_11566/g.32818 Transcript_11566/m.32818 type:complete len:200 (-) Transcript_11566:490-1089(-)